MISGGNAATIEARERRQRAMLREGRCPRCKPHRGENRSKADRKRDRRRK